METFTAIYRKMLEANRVPKPETDIDDLVSNLHKELVFQSEHTMIFINGEAIKPYLELLSEVSTILYQLVLNVLDLEKIKIVNALDVLGGISDYSRNCLFDQAIVLPLVDVLNNSTSEELTAAILRTYKNLGSEDISNRYFASMYCFGLPVITQFIFHGNQGIVADTIIILGYIASCHSNFRWKKHEIVIGRSAFKIVSEKLSSCDHPLNETDWRAVSCIASLNRNQNQVLLESGILSCINRTLKCEIPKHRNLALRTLAALLRYANSIQISVILQTQILSYMIHELLDKDNADPETVEYSLRSIQNLTYSTTGEQIAKLVSDGCIKALCKYLKLHTDANILFMALDSLGNILPHGEALSECKEPINHFVEIMTSCDGESLLEDVRNNDYLDSKIRNAAKDILVCYIPMEFE